MAHRLSIPAVRQILSKLAKGDKEEEELIEKLEDSCLRYDHDKKGMLTPDEYFNVLKIQNGVDCSKDEVKTVCLPLPCSKDGKIKIRDFLYLDIHRYGIKYQILTKIWWKLNHVYSEAAFKAMDRNKDGYITKGELKLAKKKMSMKEVDETIKDYDLDNDGKLNYEEFLKSQG